MGLEYHSEGTVVIMATEIKRKKWRVVLFILGILIILEMLDIVVLGNIRIKSDLFINDKSAIGKYGLTSIAAPYDACEYYPLLGTFEALGYTVQWNEAGQAIVYINDKKYIVDLASKEMFDEKNPLDQLMAWSGGFVIIPVMIVRDNDIFIQSPEFSRLMSKLGFTFRCERLYFKNELKVWVDPA